MNKEFFDSVYTGYLKFSSYENIIEDLYLAALIESYSRVSRIQGVNSMIENKIRDEFVFDLENNNNLLREFLQNKTIKLTNENRIIEATANYRTDVEFFVSVQGTFVVECKRLSSVEQSYIDEGVARFVSLQYSKNETEAGMLGFVISGDINKITTGLKERCAKYEPADDMNTYINTLCLKRNESFHSKHKRDSISPILIHHQFFDLTK